MVSTKKNQGIQITKSKDANSYVGKIQTKLDNFQIKHDWAGYPYAILKKYSQDEAGYQAALITYYGFLSLFPLLVVAMSITELSAFRGTHLKSQIAKALNNYFPLVGNQIQSNIHAQQKIGIALAISIIITLYGSRGVATVLQQALDHIWQVPRARRVSGIKQIIKNIEIILLAALGFILTGVLSSFGANSSSSLVIRLVVIAISLVLTFSFLLVIFKVSISSNVRFKDLLLGSAIAAIGLQIVQAGGGFIVIHELKHFGSLYGSLAIVFVVLFWIYLQVRILMYASEIDSVRKFKLWPRSLTGFRLTLADRRALKLYAKREAFARAPSEEIKVEFN